MNNGEKYFNDGSIDEITYVKDNMKIIFQEDLREHIMNLFIIDTKTQMGKVYYREIIMNKELLGIDKIKDTNIFVLKSVLKEFEEIQKP